MLIHINSNEPIYYPFTVIVNKCGESWWETIDDLYSEICVPNKQKKMNIEVFNLISRLNETRLIVQQKK